MALKRQVQSPSRKLLRFIKVTNIPKNTGTLVEPVVEMYWLNPKGEYKLVWTDNPHYKFKKGDPVISSMNPTVSVNAYKDS